MSFFLLQKKNAEKTWDLSGPDRNAANFFFCDDHFADVFRATRLRFRLFFIFIPTKGEIIGKSDLRVIFFEQMGLDLNHQLSCPDIFFRVHEEERFVRVSGSKKGVYPKMDGL